MSRRTRLLPSSLLACLFVCFGGGTGFAAAPAHWSYVDADGVRHAFVACDNVGSGGTIGNDVEGCANPTFQPPTFVNVTLPTGGSDALEYLWMETTTNPASGAPVSWTTIAGTNSADYRPAPVTQTTYFMRCARRAGCDEYAGESNFVTVLIDCCDNVTDGGAIDGDQFNCGVPYDATLIANRGAATGGSNALEYTWYQSTTTEVYAVGDPAWSAVPNVTTPYYTPGELRQTTHYVRTAKREFCPVVGAFTDVVSVEVYPLPALKADVQDVSCNGGADGEVTITILNATGTFTGRWIDDGSSDLTRTNLVAGDYSYEITDEKGCVGLETVTINEPAELLATVRAVFDPCQFTDATLEVSAAGGTEPYSYLWSTGETSSVISDKAPGTYTVFVVDANDCAVQETVEVDPPTALTLTETHTEPVCYQANGSITVTAAGGIAPFEYLWQPGVSASNSASNLPGGDYTVTVRDANACEATVTVQLDDTPPINIAFAPTNVLCGGQSTGAVDATITGGRAPYDYLWSNGATTEDLTDVPAGIYELQVTDAANCQRLRTYEITEPQPFTAGITATQIVCSEDGGALRANLSGGSLPYAFDWAAYGRSNQSPLNAVPAGEYVLRATDAVGCAASDTVTIVPVQPLELTTGTLDATCPSEADGEASVLVNGGQAGYSIVWSDPGAQTTATATNLLPGTYTVSVTDALGCVRFETAVVEQQSTGPIIAADLDSISCFGGDDGAIDLTLSGGQPAYTVAWADGPTTEDRADLRAGTYEVEVTDVIGCTADASFDIEEPAELTCSARPTSRYRDYFNVSRFGATDGAASANPVGGTAPYTYLWSNGSTAANPNDLPGKISMVTVTDSEGCSCSDTTLLEEPSLIADFAWEDTDGDGIQDAGEPGLEGVSITLSGSDLNGRQVNFSTTTDAAGEYRFDQLPIGNYTLFFQVPDFQDYLHSPFAQGPDRALDSDMDPVTGSTTRTVSANCTADYDTDAGYIPRSSVVTIGDEVWYDQNHNGLREQFEQVLQGVTLRLVRAADAFVVSSAVSNEDGKYAFSEVAPGTYYVEIDQASSSIGRNFALTVKNVNGTTAEDGDNDFDPATNRTDDFVVTPATLKIENLDAGLHAGCGEVAQAGVIVGDEEVCRGDLPTELTSLVASGAAGTVSYSWIRSATATYRGPNDPNWQTIPGASQESYQPSTLANTVHYIRLANVNGCIDYTGTSNTITKTVKPVPTAQIASASGTGPWPFDGQRINLCRDDALTVTADSSAPHRFYWNFGNNATPRLDTGRVGGPASFSAVGTYFVRLWVAFDGCAGGDSIQVNVINQDCASPFTVADVNALAAANHNLVTWRGLEVNEAYYDIERAGSDGRFEVIDQVPAATREEWVDYSYEDRYAPRGRVSYRVVRRALTGRAETSELTTVESEQVDMQLAVYPNPTHGTVTLTVATAAGGETRYELLNSLGSRIARGVSTSGAHAIDLSGLSPGTYYVRAISADGSVGQQTVIKQ